MFKAFYYQFDNRLQFMFRPSNGCFVACIIDCFHPTSKQMSESCLYAAERKRKEESCVCAKPMCWTFDKHPPLLSPSLLFSLLPVQTSPSPSHRAVPAGAEAAGRDTAHDPDL